MADERDLFPDVGQFIRAQREIARMSVRRLADLAGVSNPYLSQIERGLRAPSERVLDAIAGALELSTEALYAEAGSTPDEERQTPAVVAAVRADPRLTARQRQAMIEVYEAFAEKGARRR